LAAASLQATAPGPVYLSTSSCFPPEAIGDALRIQTPTVTMIGGNAVLSNDKFVACLPG
jgi:hypothetical protein